MFLGWYHNTILEDITFFDNGKKITLKENEKYLIKNFNEHLKFTEYLCRNKVHNLSGKIDIE